MILTQYSIVNGTLTCDHIKRLINLTFDYIKRLLLYQHTLEIKLSCYKELIAFVTSQIYDIVPKSSKSRAFLVLKKLIQMFLQMKEGFLITKNKEQTKCFCFSFWRLFDCYTSTRVSCTLNEFCVLRIFLNHNFLSVPLRLLSPFVYFSKGPSINDAIQRRLNISKTF